MKRSIDVYLLKWKAEGNRKSLLLRGARQVGKTYAVRALGKTFDSYVEINFELEPQIIQVFEKDLNPTRLIRDLSVHTGKNIIPGKTLLFFDEVQLAPKALTSLRYFYEEMPELHVIAAGSYLALAIEEVGVPVGRITMLNIRPMSFLEFLMAQEKELLADQIRSLSPQTPFSASIHDLAISYLGQYLAVGGMPEAVVQWREHQDFTICHRVHLDIIRSYRQDLDKYSGKHGYKHAGLLFDAVPRQMGTKFRYYAIHGDYRKSELAPGLDLLLKIGVVSKVFHTSAQGVPLGATANPDKFKVIFADVALAQTLLGNSPNDLILQTRGALSNKGALIEAFIGQEILAYSDPYQDDPLYYWHREARSSNAEIDYVIQKGSDIIPIEVKSGSTGWLKSMYKFLEEHPGSTFGLRFYDDQPQEYARIRSYPLYAVSAALGLP